MHKILKDVLSKGRIYQDEAHYNPKDFSFTADEFREYTEDILNKLDWDGYKLEGATFPTYLIPIEEDGHKFILRVMFGQGSAYDIFTEAKWVEFYTYLKEKVWRK